MSRIKVNVQNGAASGQIEMEDASHEHKSALIRGFMRIFSSLVPGRAAGGAEPTTSKAKAVRREPDVLLQKAEAKPRTAPVLRSEPQEPAGDSIEVSKPPLLHSERTLSVSIGEAVAAPADEPEWWKTGIKYKNGVPHYRCRYWCKNPNCRDKGSDYIRGGEIEIRCRKCGQKLAVRLATGEYQDIKTLLPERDQWGNFYIADRLVNG
ncbi:hypothetical protein WJ0W_006922 [Paenibacillus melissococcoides]|uniref:Uncharacterized protein n=1 Tax=Paenibacillus melissococcoides TaxID=2912268 RepID=A0ABN8UER5_9BACL|nr:MULTISPECIES: hypothetical protein [Paenibacillus]MEB9894854.1 hypothetical protein [Bacillus cereus]CAH8246318.1 hypothetical protein WJ0W_003553 [Paenibacillus melissococcoides]CAH8248422.1 hypothetical protein WJ0W_005685 [Paenibacillus melissococcoides]CAH8249454.1 hypothetical protein WJ0W_006639 [Paenibacillus melissococcoides]CAH8249738.1 hypothetical protein WJ0W_006922 [Paenibacillus melissococcoides]